MVSGFFCGEKNSFKWSFDDKMMVIKSTDYEVVEINLCPDHARLAFTTYTVKQIAHSINSTH